MEQTQAELWRLLQETVARYVTPGAAVVGAELAPMAAHELGWSGGGGAALSPGAR